LWVFRFPKRDNITISPIVITALFTVFGLNLFGFGLNWAINQLVPIFAAPLRLSDLWYWGPSNAIAILVILVLGFIEKRMETSWVVQATLQFRRLPIRILITYGISLPVTLFFAWWLLPGGVEFSVTLTFAIAGLSFISGYIISNFIVPVHQEKWSVSIPADLILAALMLAFTRIPTALFYVIFSFFQRSEAI
jgi:hypothetical protein